MIAVQDASQDFLDALRGSHTQVVQVDAYRGGELLSPEDGLPVAGGQVTITAGQPIRTQVSVTVADPDGVWAPAADGALSPYGSQLHVRAGVRAGALLQYFSLVWAPITTAQTSERWQPYQRVDKTVQVSRGQSTEVTATDRAQVVAGSRFLGRTQPLASTVFAEIGQLLSGVVPWWAPPSGVTDKPVPAGITYQDDRLAAIGTLAAVVNADLIFTEEGVATLTPRAAVGASVWTVPLGPQDRPAVIAFDRELSADNTYNGVIARGTTFNGQPVIGQAVIGDGPMRWDGPYGRVPWFFDSAATIGTQADANSAAINELARLQRERTQTLTVQCVSNPALEVGDTVTLTMANGTVDGLVMSATWPLVPGGMSLTVAVDPDLLAQVI